jgi:hypothetical protein
MLQIFLRSRIAVVALGSTVLFLPTSGAWSQNYTPTPPQRYTPRDSPGRGNITPPEYRRVDQPSPRPQPPPERPSRGGFVPSAKAIEAPSGGDERRYTYLCVTDDADAANCRIRTSSRRSAGSRCSCSGEPGTIDDDDN